MSQIAIADASIDVEIQNRFFNMNEIERKDRLSKMVKQNPNDGRWLCQICNQSFSRKRIATDHIEGVHIRILSYPCEYCHESFTSQSLRRQHTFHNHREHNKLAKFLN